MLVVGHSLVAPGLARDEQLIEVALCLLPRRRSRLAPSGLIEQAGQRGVLCSLLLHDFSLLSHLLAALFGLGSLVFGQVFRDNRQNQIERCFLPGELAVVLTFPVKLCGFERICKVLVVLAVVDSQRLYLCRFDPMDVTCCCWREVSLALKWY